MKGIEKGDCAGELGWEVEMELYEGLQRMEMERCLCRAHRKSRKISKQGSKKSC